jgi:NAD(P)-dependent dehydrogenase (short-subunit alcohol dehydrogenase family)
MKPPRVLITGASSEIGAALSAALSPRYSVILAGRDAARLQRALASCAPGEHSVWRADLEQPAAIAAALESGVLAHGPVSHFIHVAGIARPGAYAGCVPEALARVFAVNVLSAMEIVRLLAQNRLNAGGLLGVVAISSIAVARAARGFSAYRASKAALEAFVAGTAAELGVPGAALRLPEVRIASSSAAATSLLQQDADAAARASWPGPGEVAQAALGLVDSREDGIFSLERRAGAFSAQRAA